MLEIITISILGIALLGMALSIAVNVNLSIVETLENEKEGK